MDDINLLVDFSKYKLVKVKDLILADWNYKEDDEQLLDNLIQNVKRNGQVENVIIRQLADGRYEVVNGNHRLMAFQKMKLEQIVAYDLGSVSLNEAKRLAIETNETKFKVDSIKLAHTMSDLLNEFDRTDLQSTMPYSDDEIDNFGKLLDFDWNEFDKEVDELEQEVNPSDMFAITLELPVGLAKRLNEQIDRIKKMLHPDEAHLEKISYVQPINKIVECVERMEKEEIV